MSSYTMRVDPDLPAGPSYMILTGSGDLTWICLIVCPALAAFSDCDPLPDGNGTAIIYCDNAKFQGLVAFYNSHGGDTIVTVTEDAGTVDFSWDAVGASARVSHAAVRQPKAGVAVDRSQWGLRERRAIRDVIRALYEANSALRKKLVAFRDTGS